jgi:hypothetical protein
MVMRIARSLRHRAAGVVGALVVGSCLITVMPAPAMAAAPSNHLRNVATGRCLDSNARGAVSANPCQPTNRYQQWRLGHFGQNDVVHIVDVATGRCLDSNVHQGVFTNSCESAKDLYQLWLPAEVLGNPAGTQWYDQGTGRVLDYNRHQGVFTNYGSDTGDAYELWTGLA